jgi:hypothetical protein
MAPPWRNIAWLVSDYFSRKSSLTAYQAIPNHRSKIDTFVFALPPGASPWSFQQPQPTIGKWSWGPASPSPPRWSMRASGLFVTSPKAAGPVPGGRSVVLRPRNGSSPELATLKRHRRTS